MSALRTFLVVAAAAAMLIGTPAKAYADDPATDTCAADGSADTGNDAMSADKDTQVADTATEVDKANHDGENTTDNANHQCGPDENGTKQNDVVGPGTNNKVDDNDQEN
jgi:hypothetical protein